LTIRTGLRAVLRDLQGAEVKKETATITVLLQRKGKTLKNIKYFF
jgi:hypothetical protein